MFLKDIKKLNCDYKLVGYIRYIEDTLMESYRSPTCAVQLRDFVVSKKHKEFLVLYLKEYGWNIVFDDKNNNEIPYIKSL